MTDHTETFTLSRPLKTHSGELSSLTLQEPTAGAFIDYGEPFSLKPRFNADGEPDGVTFVFDNNKVFARWLADMVAESVDDLILKSLTASDFHLLRLRAANIIMAGMPEQNFSNPSAG